MTALQQAAMQQALEAINGLKDNTISSVWYAKAEVAIVALRQALEVEQQTEPVTRPFDIWSSNEGDSWHDDPADAQIIEDVFGGDVPVIGDEYEVLAGWRCITSRYRITFVSEDGDCEVECISHTHQQTEPLTDDEIKDVLMSAYLGDNVVRIPPGWRKVIRAVEAAHGIVDKV